MSTLSKEFRRQLENAVLKAREEAERGAAATLEAFGVADTKPPGHLDDAGKDLRRKLRAHGRQVGDVRRPDESQGVEHLIHECAYVHWHRMLFARFLAENGFLIEPESGLDVDLDFCEEQARESNSDKWEVAAGFAQRMLTGVFRADDPVLQVRL
ncbi:MAG: SAM-dependent DNA methyltransferase, partial [Verrucomicrobiota bacterium]